MTGHTLEVPYTSKPISCILSCDEGVNSREKALQTAGTPSLIFTHGAGGTLTSDGILNFSTGFAKQLPILCFQGNMNLKSRVKMFTEVTKHQKFATCLGGRSMGARAAVMAATEDTKLLILASYPLHTEKETRDQILLDIDPSIKVLFVVGDKDTMCNLSRLGSVRQKMKCKTWLAVVEGADHGMSVNPKSVTAQIGTKTGEVAAEWVQARDNERREGTILWDEEAKWSGWTQEPHTEMKVQTVSPTELKPKAPKRKQSFSKQDNIHQGEHVSSRTRKRRKM